jgi:hypothetical protein
MTLKIFSKHVLVFQLIAIGFLTVGDVVALWLKFGLGHDFVFGIVPLFDFNEEMNVPTFYSSIVMVVAAALLALIATEHRKKGERHLAWYGLAAIFAFLAFDENAGIHELLQDPASNIVAATGFLFHAWIVPYGIALIVLVAAYLRFLVSLPRQAARLFVISGLTFVAGALGFESLGGSHLELNGANMSYHVLTTIEEFLEMSGIALFIYALLVYIECECTDLRVAFGDPDRSVETSAPVALAPRIDIAN